jgi:hypothetical protein
MVSLSLAANPTEARKFFRDDEMRSGTPGPDVVRVRMPSVSRAWGSISIVVVNRNADVAQDHHGSSGSKWHCDEGEPRRRFGGDRPVRDEKRAGASIEARPGLRLLARTKRRANRSRRTPTQSAWTAFRRDRDRVGRTKRTPGQACGHHPHHQQRARSGSDPLACTCEALAALSRHQGRAQHRLWPDRHRCGTLRRRRSSRRASSKGHDCGAHRPRLSHGGRRRAFLFRQTPEAEEPAGFDSTTASTSDCRPMAASTLGNSKSEGVHRRCASKDSWSSTTSL